MDTTTARYWTWWISICLSGIFPIHLAAQAPNPAQPDFQFTTRAAPQTNVDLHPFILEAGASRLYATLAGFGVQVGRHELGAGCLISRQMAFGGLLQYRYYLARNQWRVQPYVGAYALRDRVRDLDVWGVSLQGAVWAAGLSFGTEFALAPGLTAFCQQGMGFSQIAAPSIRAPWAIFDGVAHLGIRGSLRVRGEGPDRSWKRAETLLPKRQLFFQVLTSGRPDLLLSRLFPASSGTLNFYLEYQATQFLRPYVGLSYGLASEYPYPIVDPYPEAVTLNGYQAGVRLHSFTQHRWAIFQDIGGCYANRKKYYYHDSRFWIGQGVSLRVVGGLHAIAILRFNVGVRGAYSDAALGLALAPFDVGR